MGAFFFFLGALCQPGILHFVPELQTEPSTAGDEDNFQQTDITQVGSFFWSILSLCYTSREFTDTGMMARVFTHKEPNFQGH